MKNFTRKLLVSIIAVAFAFVAMGTSTYAWFSMNTKVSATGMELSAKADSVYLLISGTNTTAATIQAENKTKADLKMEAADNQVYPACYTSTTYTTTAATTAANWGYAYSTDPSAPQVDAEVKALSSLTDYVITKKFYVTLSKNSVPAENLTISEVTLPDDTGISCVISTSEGGANYTTSFAATEQAPGTVIAASITDEAVVEITVSLYVNGKDAAVFQDNLAALTGALSFKLTCSVKKNG